MNKKQIDLEVITILYLKYKEYLLPVIGFAVSVFVFIQFVIPQINNFFSTQDSIVTSEQTILSLTQNYNTAASMDDNQTQQMLNIANHALPPIKDFSGILNAISAASAQSGITLDDYSFQLGDINSAGVAQGSANPTVQISLTVKGDVEQTKNFLSALSRQLPISEISGLTLNNETTSTIVADFFYLPQNKTNFVDTNPIPVLSNVQKKLINDLEQNAIAPLAQTVQQSSPSAH